MDTATRQARLGALLAQQQDGAAAMLAALEAEYHALQARDLNAFEQAVAEKQRTVAYLEQQERHSLPEVARLIDAAPSGQNITAFVLRTRDAALSETWQTLQQTLGVCREQNLLNQRILETSRQRLRQTLALLRGEDGRSGTYAHSGRTDEDDRGGQSLAMV